MAEIVICDCCKEECTDNRTKIDSKNGLLDLCSKCLSKIKRYMEKHKKVES